MTADDVEHALRHMHVRVPPEARVELDHVSPVMLMRALHHELFYAQTEARRARARVKRDVGRVAHGVVGAFLQHLLRGAAQRATRARHRVIDLPHIERAYADVLRAVTARREPSRDVSEWSRHT